MKLVVNNIKKIVVCGMVLLLVLVILGGVAPAEKKLVYPPAPRAPGWEFNESPSVLRLTLDVVQLSPDGGATWTGNLLDGTSSVDFASVGIGEKAGTFFSHKALPPTHYNWVKFHFSSLGIKGVVAVDPDDWGGTWPGGGTETRYYYTNAAGTGDTYAASRSAAEAAPDYAEMQFTDGWDEFSCDIDVLVTQTTTSKLWAGGYIQYITEYDEQKVFTGGRFGTWASAWVE